MTPQEQLIGELAELENGALHKELISRREEIVRNWTASDDEKRDLISKGEKRILDRLIQDIESARENLKKRRQGAERSHMSKAF